MNSAIDENNQYYFELEGNSVGDDNDIRIRQLSSGSVNTLIKTSASFRDVSAWYHIVVAVDTTQATASNRIKLYVNGSQITAFDSSTYPSQNTDMQINTTSYTTHIGKRNNNSAYFDGYMAEVVFIDGQQLDPTSFGEFDADTGIWKPINVSGLTFGTNGFYLPFENSAALGQDDSGNGNNFTVNNLTSIDQTTDTPTNNFATMNPLRNYATNPTYSEGNLKLVSGGGAWHGSSATLAFGKGKWYWEIKLTGTMTNHFIGVQSINGNTNTAVPMYITGSTVFYNNDGGKIYIDGSAQAGTYGIFSSGDIMGLAVDIDAGTYGQITIYKNGVAIVSNFNLASTTSDTIYPFIGGLSSTQEINFGNPPFTISSGNSDADGYGNFEYAVPSGYYALCTKNLAEYG